MKFKTLSSDRIAIICNNKEFKALNLALSMICIISDMTKDNDSFRAIQQEIANEYQQRPELVNIVVKDDIKNKLHIQIDTQTEKEYREAFRKLRDQIVDLQRVNKDLKRKLDKYENDIEMK